MSDNTGSAKLFASLAQIMADVRSVEKAGRNEYDRYDYVRADDALRAIGRAMAKHNVAFLPSVVEVATAETQTQKGGVQYKTTVHMLMTFACGESGATWAMDWYGEGMDRGDKSIAKAMTSATKYFLL